MCRRCTGPRAYCPECGNVVTTGRDGTAAPHERATTTRPKPVRRRWRPEDWWYGWQIADGVWTVQCPGTGQPTTEKAP